MSFSVKAPQEQEQNVLDALDIFPKDEEFDNAPKGQMYRKAKKSHLESFKELVESGANSPMFAVKKDKHVVKDGNFSSFEALPSSQDFDVPSDEEMLAIMKKLEDTDIQCWRTQSTESTEGDSREREINALIMSF